MDTKRDISRTFLDGMFADWAMFVPSAITLGSRFNIYAWRFHPFEYHGVHRIRTYGVLMFVLVVSSKLEEFHFFSDT